MSNISSSSERAHRRPHVIATVAVVLSVLTGACTKNRSEEAASTSSGPVKVGEVAPGFSLPSATGDEVSLADFAGKKAVLLYFSMGPG